MLHGNMGCHRSCSQPGLRSVLPQISLGSVYNCLITQATSAVRCLDTSVSTMCHHQSMLDQGAATLLKADGLTRGASRSQFCDVRWSYLLYKIIRLVLSSGPMCLMLPCLVAAVYQSIGGAVSTGSHGSSLPWASLSNQVGCAVDISPISSNIT